MNINEIKNSIEALNFFHQKEILKILYKNKCNCLSENNNGTFVNMTKLPNKIIDELVKYIHYVNVQEKELKNKQIKCNEIEENYFKDNKDNVLVNNNAL